MDSEETTSEPFPDPDSERPAVPRRRALDVQDLSGEWPLRGCRQIEFEGRQVPSLRGIAILARLGKGGMGVVYYGVHPLLRTELAVKVLPVALLQHQEVLVDRFVREAQLAASLRSEHLVEVRDVGHDVSSGCYYIVMEFVHGLSAGAWRETYVQRGKPGAPQREALEVCIAATAGLAAAHLAGIVHRDIKPENILIPSDARGGLDCRAAKLADLGLARAEAAGEGLTGTHVAMGTPGFMAPEQVTDARMARKPADVFGMGATLYSLLSSHAPFEGKSPSDALVRTAGGKYPPIRDVRPDVSPSIAMVIDHCLGKQPKDRFPDAPALLDALRVCRAALAEDGTVTDAAISTQVVAFANQEERGAKVISTPPTARTIREDPASTTGAAPVTVPPEPDEETRLPSQAPPPPADPLASPVSAFGDGTQSIALRALDMLGVGMEEPEPIEEPSRSLPVGLFVGLGAFVLVVLAAILVFTLGGDEEGAAPDVPDEPVLPVPAATTSLRVTSAPPGADVYVNGEPRGKTPLDLDGIAVDRHDVRVALPFYEEQSWEHVAVARGPDNALHADLVREKGKVAAEGGAPGAKVLLRRSGKPPRSYAFDLDAGGRLAQQEIEAGEYVVVVHAEGFAEHRETIEIRADAPVSVTAPMVALDGTLSLDSSPSGASVSVDGAAVGTTPLEGHALRPGDHEVRLELPRHEPATFTVTIVPGQSTNLPAAVLAPWSLLDLAALGEGVTAWVGGERVANGRVAPPGPVVVELRRSGFAPQRHDLTARAGEPLVVTPRGWDPLAAVLDMEALLPDVTAWLDGKPVERVVSKVGERAWRVTVELRRPGFRTQTVTTTVDAGRTLKIPPRQWVASGGAVDLSQLGGGVTAFLGNRRLRDGETLPEGTYTLRLARSGYADQTVTVTVPGGGGRTAPVVPRAWATTRGSLDLSGLGRDVSVLLNGRRLTHGAKLAPGNYTLTLRRPGYRDIIVPDVPIVAGHYTPIHDGQWERAGQPTGQPPSGARADPGILRDVERWDRATPAQRRGVAEAVAAGAAAFRLKGLERFDAGGQSHEIAVFVHAKTGMEFSLIPAGRFRMGSPSSELGREDDEIPHGVRLTNPFLLSRTEVPQSVWEKFAGRNDSRWQGAELPADTVSFRNAAIFARSLDLTLPMEAQWEYACRAGAQTPYYFGDNERALEDFAWYGDNARRVTHRVGLKRPNAFGLYDMHGNVWEWCADAYGRYSSGDVTDPFGDERDPRYRVLRGGGYGSGSGTVRSAEREKKAATYSDDSLGLRLMAPVRIR